MSWDELISALDAFLTARDHAAWRAVIEAHPELFTRTVEEILVSVPCPAANPQERSEREQLARLWLARLKMIYAASLLQQIGHAKEDSQLALVISACEDALAIVEGSIDAVGVSLTLGSAYLISRQGQAVANQKRAIALWEQALPLVPKEKSDVALTLQIAIADAYVALAEDIGDEAVNSAINACKKALHQARCNGNLELWAQIQQKLGRSYALKETGEGIKSAIKAYGEALTVYTRKKHPQKWADLQVSLGGAYGRLESGNRPNNLRKAIVAYEGALAVFTRKNNPDDWARAAANLAAVYGQDRSGDVVHRQRTALALVESALEFISEQRDPENWAVAQSTRGILHLDLTEGHPADNLECAISALRSARDIFARRNRKRSWAGSMMNLGVAYTRRIRGDPAENKELAIEALNGALSVFTRNDAPELWSRTQSILGESYLNRLRGEVEKNLEAAIAALGNALTIPLGHREPHVRAHLGIALLRHSTEVASADRDGDLEAGIASLEHALTDLERERDPFAWAGIQQTLGIGYREKARWPDAIGAYASALTVYSAETYPRQRADVLANMANLMGHCARECLGGFTDGASQAVTALLYRLSAMGGPEFRTILAVLREVSIIAPAVVARVGDGKAEQAKQFTLTTELMTALWNQAIACLPPGVDDRRRSDFMFRLGEWQLTFGQLDEAAELLANALKLREHLVSSTLTRENVFDIVSKTSGVGETLAYCRIKLGQRELGLEELERAQATELRRILASEAPLLAKLDAERRAAILEARERLRRLQYEFSRDVAAQGSQRSGAEVAAEIRATQTALMAALGEAQAGDSEEPSLSAREILALAPDRSIVIVPLVTFRGGAVYVIPSGTSELTKDHVIELPELTTRAVEDRLKSWRRGYEAMKVRADQGIPEAWRYFQPVIEDVLSWLWDELMQPALDRTRKAGFRPDQPTEIIILASGGLSYLPLHAAWNRAANWYVLDDYAVTLAPSFGVSRTCARRATESERGCGGLVGVFDPEQDDPDRRLELSETFEWPQLRNSFRRHGEGAKPLIGKDATPARVTSASREAGYLHFSCHNEFDWSRPGRSGMALAGGEVMDLQQIAGELELPRCRLVSIAACETAITAAGKLASEQIGLPAAFIQAGAPAVVATLWPVMDWSTAVIMARMYDLLLDRRDWRPAQALQQAVLEFRDGRLPPSVWDEAKDINPDLDHRLPFFWAPFVAIGR